MTSAAKLVKVSPSVIVSFSMYLSVFFLPIIFRGLSVNLLFFFFIYYFLVFEFYFFFFFFFFFSTACFLGAWWEKPYHCL